MTKSKGPERLQSETCILPLLGQKEKESSHSLATAQIVYHFLPYPVAMPVAYFTGFGRTICIAYCIDLRFSKYGTGMEDRKKMGLFTLFTLIPLRSCKPGDIAQDSALAFCGDE